MKIKLSKKQWDLIGKNAGWNKLSQEKFDAPITARDDIIKFYSDKIMKALNTTFFPGELGVSDTALSEKTLELAKWIVENQLENSDL